VRQPFFQAQEKVPKVPREARFLPKTEVSKLKLVSLTEPTQHEITFESEKRQDDIREKVSVGTAVDQGESLVHQHT
jgi:hypothetical protein